MGSGPSPGPSGGDPGAPRGSSEQGSGPAPPGNRGRLCRAARKLLPRPQTGKRTPAGPQRARTRERRPRTRAVLARGRGRFRRGAPWPALAAPATPGPRSLHAPQCRGSLAPPKASAAANNVGGLGREAGDLGSVDGFVHLCRPPTAPRPVLSSPGPLPVREASGPCCPRIPCDMRVRGLDLGLPCLERR